MSKAFHQKIHSLINQNKALVTGFLTPEEQDIIAHIDSSILLSGGSARPIRQRAYIKSPIQDDIVCFKITSKSPYLSLRHSSILGSLMGLDLKREDIGDILVNEACFFVTKAVEKRVLYGLKKIGKHPIDLTVYDGSDLKAEIQLAPFNIIVTSMRLDVIVKAILHVPRQKAVAMIDNNLVKVNDFACDKPAKTLEIQDVISIRHSGKYVISESVKTSKKGKIVLNIGKYV